MIYDTTMTYIRIAEIAFDLFSLLYNVSRISREKTLTILLPLHQGPFYSLIKPHSTPQLKPILLPLYLGPFYPHAIKAHSAKT